MKRRGTVGKGRRGGIEIVEERRLTAIDDRSIVEGRWRRREAKCQLKERRGRRVRGGKVVAIGGGRR